MSLSAKEAADMVGMTKAGIIKAIGKGKISGTKDEQGQWRIDPAELTRVYKPVDKGNDNQVKPVNDSLPFIDSGLQVKIDAQDEQIKLLRERLAAADEQNEKLLKMLNEQISTVRQLTDQRAGQGTKKAGLWARVFG